MGFVESGLVRGFGATGGHPGPGCGVGRRFEFDGDGTAYGVGGSGVFGRDDDGWYAGVEVEGEQRVGVDAEDPDKLTKSKKMRS